MYSSSSNKKKGIGPHLKHPSSRSLSCSVPRLCVYYNDLGDKVQVLDSLVAIIDESWKRSERSRLH